MRQPLEAAPIRLFDTLGDFLPVQRRRDRRPGHGPQDIGRDGVVAAGVLQHVDVDPLAPLRLADVDGRLVRHRLGRALGELQRPGPSLVVIRRPASRA